MSAASVDGRPTTGFHSMNRVPQDRDRDAGAGSTTCRHDECETTSAARAGARRLQQSVGNQAVQRRHERGDLQARLETAHPRDSAEREAERVAQRVLDAEPAAHSTDDEENDRNSEREAPETAERPVARVPHRRRTVTVTRTAGEGTRTGTGTGTGTGDAEKAVRQAFAGGGRPLPETPRSFFESRFGADFSDVRVHTGPAADTAARSIDAEAFTVGTDVAFAKGNYDPGTTAGKRLLAHELTHVVQQTGAGGRGRIQRQENGDSSDGDASDTGSSEPWPPEGWSEEPYDVTGDLCDGLWENMKAAGPEGKAGTTDYKRDWDFESEQRGGCTGDGCECTATVSELVVNVTQRTVEMPEWTGYDDATESEQRRWDAYVEGLRAHERRHVEIVEAWRERAEESLEREFGDESATETGTREDGQQLCTDAGEALERTLERDVDDAFDDLVEELEDEHETFHDTEESPPTLDCDE